MSTRLSKEITDCFRAGRSALSALEVEGPRVEALFLDVTRPHGEGDGEPGPIGFLSAIENKLRASLDLLIEADSAVTRAVGLESELRHRHKDDKRQLAFLIVALRRMVLAQYVEPDMDNLGLQPVNVRDGMTILRRGELIGQRFEAPNLAQMLGASRFAGGVDLSPFVAEIRAKSAALFSLSEEVDEAHRFADQARINRGEAKEDFDRVYLRGVRMFEDMCRFVGLDDLAGRVRRPERRKAVEEPVAEEAVAEEAVAEGMVTVTEEMVTEEMASEISGGFSRLRPRSPGIYSRVGIRRSTPVTPPGLCHATPLG